MLIVLARLNPSNIRTMDSEEHMVADSPRRLVWVIFINLAFVACGGGDKFAVDALDGSASSRDLVPHLEATADGLADRTVAPIDAGAADAGDGLALAPILDLGAGLDTPMTSSDLGIDGTVSVRDAGAWDGTPARIDGGLDSGLALGRVDSGLAIDGGQRAACPGTSILGPALSAAKVLGSPNAIVVADVNLDGRQDVLTTSSPGTVSVLFGLGDGTFSPHADYAVGKGPIAIVVSDLNRDGIPDVVTANSDAISVSVLLGKGDGTFAAAAPSDTALTINPKAIAVGDVDLDGNPDIVTANSKGDTYMGTASLLRGRGNGSFGFIKDYAAGKNPSAVALGDPDLDGKPDMVVLNAGVDNSWSGGVYLGSGNGTFTAGATFETGMHPTAVALRDMNADGKVDVVMTSTFSSLISVLLGKGDGTFSTKVDSDAGGAQNASLAVADMNGDGKLDVVVSLGGSQTLVSVLFGKGDGTLPSRYSTNIPSVAIAVGDVNGDGRPDVAVANSDGVTILPGACQ